MFIFTKFVLVLITHNAFSQQHDFLTEKRMNLMKTELVTEINNIKDEMAMLEEKLISKFILTMGKQNTVNQVNISFFQYHLATVRSIYFCN